MERPLRFFECPYKPARSCAVIPPQLNSLWVPDGMLGIAELVFCTSAVYISIGMSLYAYMSWPVMGSVERDIFTITFISGFFIGIDRAVEDPVRSWIIATVGEFRFRRWHYAKTAYVRKKLCYEDRTDEEQWYAEGLVPRLQQRTYLLKVEVGISWGNRMVISYLPVGKKLFEHVHNGMSLSLEYRVSRLHPNRLQVRLMKP